LEVVGHFSGFAALLQLVQQCSECDLHSHCSGFIYSDHDTGPWDLCSTIQDWLASQNSMHGGKRLLR